MPRKTPTDTLPTDSASRVDSDAIGTDRLRRIVQIAAQGMQNEIVRLWLFEDERGIWEHEAARLLAIATPRAIERKLTDAQVNVAIGIELALQALYALKSTQKPKPPKKGKKP